MFEWLFGKDEQPDLECSCCNEHVVFEGTTEELLRATQEAMNPPVEMPVEVPQEEETMEEVKGPSNDQVWTSIEFLKMAMEIEAAKNQRMVFYVDVGNLPKAKAEAYMKETQRIGILLLKYLRGSEQLLGIENYLHFLQKEERIFLRSLESFLNTRRILLRQRLQK